MKKQNTKIIMFGTWTYESGATRHMRIVEILKVPKNSATPASYTIEIESIMEPGTFNVALEGHATLPECIKKAEKLTDKKINWSKKA
ncbi:MAG: hypothetical protein HQK50_06540 [Oligoflexia bacterium]|nr:hypothetical protein [Oligoflexia bacterium]MBF0365210.1 hypothetical protein [Oligoflexia bacterium]